MWRRNNHVPDGSGAWIAFNEPQSIVWVMEPRPIDLDSVRLCAMSNDVFAAKNASEGLKERGLTNKRKRGFVSRNACSENEFSCHDPLSTPNEQSVQLGIPIAERRLQCSAPEGLVQFVWKVDGQRHLSWNLRGNAGRIRGTR